MCQPAASSEPGEQARTLRGWLVLGGEVEHAEPGRPSIGASGECPKLIGRQANAVGAAVQLIHLPRAKAEGVRVDLLQIAGKPAAFEVAGRWHPAADEKAQILRLRVDE